MSQLSQQEYGFVPLINNFKRTPVCSVFIEIASYTVMLAFPLYEWVAAHCCEVMGNHKPVFYC